MLSQLGGSKSSALTMIPAQRMQSSAHLQHSCRRTMRHRLQQNGSQRAAWAALGCTLPCKGLRLNTVIRHAQKQQFASFDDMVQNSELPVLVDFHATWCGPCQIMSNILSNLSKQMGDKIKIVKIDTDKYPKIATRYSIQALPTLLVFKDGKQADRIEGNDAGRMLMNGQLLTDRLQYLLFSKATP